jgi:hypothetical protein
MQLEWDQTDIVCERYRVLSTFPNRENADSTHPYMLTVQTVLLTWQWDRTGHVEVVDLKAYVVVVDVDQWVVDMWHVRGEWEGATQPI